MPPSKRSREKLIQRREFLQKGALAGAAIVGSATNAAAQAQTPPAPATPPGPTTPIMTAAAEATPPGEVQFIPENQRSGSDYMVDVFKSLGFEYVCANPGSSFRGLHESIINYGGNQSPELIS